VIPPHPQVLGYMRKKTEITTLDRGHAPRSRPGCGKVTRVKSHGEKRGTRVSNPEAWVVSSSFETRPSEVFARHLGA